MARGPGYEVAAGGVDHFWDPMPRHIGRIEPFEREHARPGERPAGNADPYGTNPALHVGHEPLGAVDRTSRAPDVTNALVDSRQVVRVEREHLRALFELQRAEHLFFGDGTDFADALRQHEIGCEGGDSSDVDLIHATVIPQRGADGRIDRTARAALEI